MSPMAIVWMGIPPAGKRWDWDTAKSGWTLVDDPSVAAVPATPLASPPVRRSDLGPFEMPVKRNKPLSADRPAVVAAGEAVRRIR